MFCFSSFLFGLYVFPVIFLFMYVPISVLCGQLMFSSFLSKSDISKWSLISFLDLLRNELQSCFISPAVNYLFIKTMFLDFVHDNKAKVIFSRGHEKWHRMHGNRWTIHDSLSSSALAGNSSLLLCGATGISVCIHFQEDENSGVTRNINICNNRWHNDDIIQ